MDYQQFIERKRAADMSRRGGSVSSPRKKEAAKLREGKKREKEEGR